MKEVEDILNKPGNGKDDDLSGMLDMDVIKGYVRKDPIRKLRQRLTINMGFGLATAMIYAYLIKLYPSWLLAIGFGSIIAFTLLGIWHTFRLSQRLGRYSVDRPMLPMLTEKRDLVREWIRQQLRAAIIFYPICAASGFMLGGSLGAGKPVTTVMSDPRILGIMVVVVAIITYPALLLGKWLTAKSFGCLVKDLDQHIEALSHE
jgi:hypothetical protein